MEPIFFSPAEGGFYRRDVHAAMPDDVVEITAEEHAALLAGQARGQHIVAGAAGRPELRDPLPVPADEWAPAVVQQHLDAVAQRAGYDSMASAVSYADEPAVPRYQREGQALRAWRSLVWQCAHEWIADRPDRPASTSTQEALLATLPIAPEL